MGKAANFLYLISAKCQVAKYSRLYATIVSNFIFLASQDALEVILWLIDSLTDSYNPGKWLYLLKANTYEGANEHKWVN